MGETKRLRRNETTRRKQKPDLRSAEVGFEMDDGGGRLLNGFPQDSTNPTTTNRPFSSTWSDGEEARSLLGAASMAPRAIWKVQCIIYPNLPSGSHPIFKNFVRHNIRHTNDFGTTRAGSLPAVDEQSCPVRWPSARVARRRLNLRTQCRMHRSCPSHVDPQVRLVLARVRKQNCLSSHGLRRAGARGRKSMPKGKGRRVV